MSPTPKKRRGRPRDPVSDPETGIVHTLRRGLVLLQVLSREGHLSLTDLSLQVGLPASSVYRLLTTLQRLKFAEYNEETHEWAVGIESFRVGNAYLERTNLMEISRNVMRDLMESTGETANLAITDGGDVVFISEVESPNPIRAFFRPGTRGYMHASGIGKALLAHMYRSEVERILQSKGCPKLTEKTLTTPSELFGNLVTTRERGWAFDDEESCEGMRCIASCIFSSYGEAIAGISVSGPTVRFPDPMIPAIGPQVREAALQITSLIGGKPHPSSGPL